MVAVITGPGNCPLTSAAERVKPSGEMFLDTKSKVYSLALELPLPADWHRNGRTEQIKWRIADPEGIVGPSVGDVVVLLHDVHRHEAFKATSQYQNRLSVNDSVTGSLMGWFAA